MKKNMLLVPKKINENVKNRHIEEKMLLRYLKKDKRVSDKFKVFYVPKNLDKTRRFRYGSKITLYIPPKQTKYSL